VTDVLGLDANVVIKLLVQEAPLELTAAARRLYTRVEWDTATLVAPAFAWAEVGSTLRKKVRTRELTANEAGEGWQEFLGMPIVFLDTPQIRARSWEIADRYNLPTLYDAAYLACTELGDVEDPGQREFWTADQRLLSHLGDLLHPYVRQLQ